MRLNLALDLVLFGALLASSGFVARWLQPDFQSLALFTGIAGGGLCVIWGILGLRGRAYRMPAMVTLAVVGCVLAGQAVQSWLASAESDANGRMGTLLIFVLAVFCMGTLANLARAKRDG